MARLLVLVFVIAVACAGEAAAQPVPPGGGAGGSQPSFSPYLNLINRGNNPALNYFGIVRPQLQAQQQFGQLAQQNQAQNQAIAANQNQLALGADPNLRFTGTVASFNNTGGYFSRHPITGRGTGGGSGFGGSGFGTQRPGQGFGPGAGAGNRSGAAGAPGGVRR